MLKGRGYKKVYMYKSLLKYFKGKIFHCRKLKPKNLLLF